MDLPTVPIFKTEEKDDFPRVPFFTKESGLIPEDLPKVPVMKGKPSIPIEQATQKFAKEHPLPTEVANEPGLKEINVMPTMLGLTAIETATAGNQTKIPYPEIKQIPKPLREVGMAFLPEKVGDIANYASYFKSAPKSLAYGAMRAISGKKDVPQELATEAATRVVIPEIIGLVGRGAGKAIRSVVDKIKGKTPELITPTETQLVGEIVKNKSMLEDLRRNNILGQNDTDLLDKWLEQNNQAAKLPLISKQKLLPEHTIPLPEKMPTPSTLSNKALFTGAKNEVKEEAKTFNKVLEVDGNQNDLLGLWAINGDKKAQKLIGPNRPKDFTLADKYIKEKVGNAYDAIKYNNKNPEIGPEFHDLNNGKFYTENPVLAHLYSKQNRELKYDLSTRMYAAVPGMFGGIEMETDKDGKPTGKVKYDPIKGSIGLIGMGVLSKYRPLVNESKIDFSEKDQMGLRSMVESVRKIVEKETKTVLTNTRVMQLAKEAEILSRGAPRETVEKLLSSLYRTRQYEAALSQSGKMTPEFIDAIKKTSEYATMAGQLLQSHNIKVAPEMYSTMGDLARKLLKSGVDADALARASEKVDFNNAEQVTKLYRSFIKPKLGEIIDEFRYINMLSSPLTHIVNTTSNVLQVGGLRPITKLASGAYDAIGSAMTGKARKQYVSEVPEFYRGLLNSLGDATKAFSDVMSGKSQIIKPDLERMPTLSPIVKPFSFVTKLLEGSDVFFQKLGAGAEKEALALRAMKSGQKISESELSDMAEQAAKKMVFRDQLDPSNASGQGKLLSAIDSTTQSVLQMGVKHPAIRWVVPFVITPMNILKQGIEYSPAGVATLPGAANKAEQLAKASIGSVVFMGTLYHALSGNSTWELPKGKKERELFYRSGKKPYSVRVGDKWVSYSKLGPLAYPMAMAAALQYVANESPNKLDYNGAQKVSEYLGEMVGFFGDQSYVQSIGELSKAAQGDWSSVNQFLTNMPKQLIPLSSLQRWVNGIIDPVYRKPKKDFSLTPFIQELQKSIIGGSFGVPPVEGTSKKDFPLVNSLSPFSVGQSRPGTEELLKIFQSQQQSRRKYKK